MPNILKKFLGGIDDVAGEIARLREQVDRTKGEVAVEQARPVPLAEVEARLDATIAGLRAQAERLVMAGELVRAEGGPLAAVLTHAQVPGFVLAAVVAPAPLAAWLREQALSAAERMGEPIDATTRSTRVNALRAKLADLERREAELWWAAFDRDLDLPPRPDADPAAVLGLAA
jgi:hypothetical protein